VPDDLTERIRRRAYRIWESEGRPAGREADHWKLASEEIAIEDGIGQTLPPGPSRGPDDEAARTEPVEPLAGPQAQTEAVGPPSQEEAQPVPRPRGARRRAKAPTDVG